MRLESARDLKQEMLTGIVVPFSRAASAPSRARARGISKVPHALGEVATFSVAATPVEEIPDIQRSVALGIARKGNQYQLAIRVQRQGLMGSPLVEHLVQQAKGEADVRMIGRVEKRTGGRGRTGTTTRPAAVSKSIVTGPWYRGNVRPLLIGASVGHVNVTAGTIGGFVTRSGRPFILSNNHVLANEDRAATGDIVVQRGSVDGGRDPKDAVGTLNRSIRLRRSGSNFVDAALARINKSIAFDSVLLRTLVGGADRRLAGLGPDFLDEGETVHKIGRTTGPTEGRVTAFDLDNVVVSYDIGNLRFDGQVEIEGVGNQAFSDGGDSGSLIVNAGMEAVALLFAGGDIGGSNGLGLTYANPIHRVLKDLKAELLLA